MTNKPGKLALFEGALNKEAKKQRKRGLRSDLGKTHKGHTLAELPAKWERFCVHFKMTGLAAQSCKIAGLNPSYAPVLKKHSLIQRRLKEISDVLITAELVNALEDYVLTEELIDRSLKQVMQSGSHEKRGYADVVAAAKIACDKMGLIRKEPGPVIANFNQVSASSEANSGNAKEVYKAKWLKSKELDWAEEADGAIIEA